MPWTCVFINNQEIDDHLSATTKKFQSFCAQMNRWRGLQYRHHQEFSFKCAVAGREGGKEKRVMKWLP